MTIIIFFIILGLLVLVHELGHFVVAKKAGVAVEEFGFGYPPRALKLGRRWGTLFSLNWIPFGGFVKILGENYEPPSSEEAGFGEPRDGITFTQIPKKWQAAILVAGVTANFVFAWILFSLGFMIGLPTSVNNDFGGEVKNPELTIIDLLPGSPAEGAGLRTGDKIKNILNINGDGVNALNPESVSNFLNDAPGEFKVRVDRGGKILDFQVEPKSGLVEDKKIIGIGMDMVGTISLPIHKSFYEGGKTTYKLTYLTVGSIVGLIRDAVQGKADVSQVAGPVGIIGLVGDASRLGFVYLLTFTALISINLAVINLVPFPALDGGRLLFVIIESATKRKINPKFAGIANTVGFALLITLMLFITYRDILKLF